MGVVWGVMFWVWLVGVASVPDPNLKKLEQVGALICFWTVLTWYTVFAVEGMLIRSTLSTPVRDHISGLPAT
jgi:hypothetical protein